MKELVRTIAKPLYYAARHIVCFVWFNSRALLARLAGRPIVFVMGAPTHRNLGDQAILLAEVEFLKQAIPRCVIIKASLRVVLQNSRDLATAVRDQDLIVGLGGGNMGEIYQREEDCRHTFIQLFPNNTIILFPQTIHFTDSERGRAGLATSQGIYAQHKHLTIIAREQISYQKMQEVFPKNNVLLTPDIVLSINRSNTPQRRDGLLFCLRDDLEGKLDEIDKQRLADFAEKHFTAVRNTDTIAKDKGYEHMDKMQVVEAKLNEFKGAKLVVTDRLHGMVFSAITGTPCIALSNFNHKVSQTYEWIKHLPYIKFCNSTKELENLFKQLDLEQTYTYDPSHLQEYWQKIQDILTSSPQVTRRSK